MSDDELLKTRARAAQAQRAEPVAWLVFDEEGLPAYACAWREAAHDHINDALQEYGIEEAARWTVRPVYAAPPPAPQPMAPMLQEQASGDAWSDGYEAGYQAGLAGHAAPPALQAQHVSGAADPAGHPAGEQTGPVSAAPTYTPQDAQPEPVSAADELQRPTTFHTEQSLADIAVAQEASLHKHAARSAAQPELLSDEQIRDLVKECGLDWHRGFAPLFDGDETNRYAVLARAIERAVTERLRGQS